MIVEEYINEIIKNGNDDDMRCLHKVMIELLEDIKEYDHDEYEEYKMKLYTIAYGEVLTDEMKDKWVDEMVPRAKWSLEDIKNVATQYGITIPLHSTYVIMNMLYSDFGSVLGSGDDNTLGNYINATKLWYYDEDASNTEEQKLFKYYYNIVK